MSTPPKVIGTPGLLRRLATIIYDSFLVFACCLVTGGGVVAIKVATTDAAQLDSMRANGERVINGPIESAILFTVCVMTVLAFYTYFWRKTGQTLAMQAWRTKLISRETKSSPTWTQCLIRFVVAFFSLGFGGLGYLWMFIDKDKLTWHDRASNTELQLLEKKKK